MSDNVRNERVLVGTTSTTIARLGDSKFSPRTAILIRNNSPNAADIITLNIGADVAVSGSGLVLNKGETWTDSNSEGYQCYQGVIQAICDTADGVLAVMER